MLTLWLATGVIAKEAPAPGAIAGQTSLTFTTTAELDTSAVITGQSALTFTTLANLTGSGGAGGAISGATSLTFALSGALAGASSVAGATSLTFTASGAVEQPIPPEPPFIRPSRNGGGSMYVLPSETATDRLRLREDQELVEIVSILATMGVFHGNR